jgi:hypothetical protein
VREVGRGAKAAREDRDCAAGVTGVVVSTMESEAVTHPIFRDAPPPETRLWRYLSFAKIIALFQTRRLHFTRIDQFDDHFEGAWPKSDLERFAELEGGQVIPKVTKAVRLGAAASCWLGADHESAAM